MKQFLYLDTDIVNSIIAQSEQGLIEAISSEISTEESKTKNKKGSAEVDTTAGTSILKLLKAESRLTLEGELAKSSTLGLTSREIISKTLHDAAFDTAYEYIKPKLIQFNNDEFNDYGNYVEISRVYDFVDLDYLENLFDKGPFQKFLKNDPSGKLTNWGEIHNVLAAFKQIIPYSRMLISYDGYLIPLDDQYFRVNPKSIGFQYGGEMKCVGIITNIIGKDAAPDNDDVFATLQFTINETLRSVLPTSEQNLCVVHPIGIYYGN